MKRYFKIFAAMLCLSVAQSAYCMEGYPLWAAIWANMSFGGWRVPLAMYFWGDSNVSMLNGHSPLSIAAAQGNVRKVEELLRRGANPNGPRPAQYDGPGILTTRLPLEEAANAYIKLGDGAIPPAAIPRDASERRERLLRVMRLLLEGGAVPHAHSSSGDRLFPGLVALCGRDDVEMIRTFLDGGADPNCQACLIPFTALHHAVGHKNIDVTCLLVEGGANPDFVCATRGGRPLPTPRQMAGSDHELLRALGEDCLHAEPWKRCFW